MEKIKSLTPYQHVRKRTEMYFGSREHTSYILPNWTSPTFELKEYKWIPSVFTCFREILDNSLDEVIGYKRGDTIKVSSIDKVFTIEDNGSGIPFDIDPETRKPIATNALTKLMTGRNFEERETVIGANGIGASGVNFCSEFFNLEIYRDNKKFTQVFTEGNIINDDLIINKHKIADTKSTKTGTKIEYKLSDKVFDDISIDDEFILNRLIEINSQNNINVYFNEKRISQRLNVLKTNHIKYKFKNADIEIEMFIFNHPDTDEYYYSVVNNLMLLDHGIHVDTWKRNFYSAFIENTEAFAKKHKLVFNKQDIVKNLAVLFFIKMKNPMFENQSKNRLVSSTVGELIKKHINENLFKLVLKNKEFMDNVVNNCTERTVKKTAKDLDNVNKSLKKLKIPDLIEANSKNRKECILCLTEGLSALYSINSVRNPKIHGLYALRGKLMNVSNKSQLDASENESLKDLTSIIGLQFNKEIPIDNLNYGKIYIMHDADEDGKNIGSLLINFFHKNWSYLFKQNFINVFMTPLLVAEKNKEIKFWYPHDYNLFDSSKYKNWEITRAKGLASLHKQHWEEIIKNPTLYPLTEDGKMKDSLSLVFDKDRADDRKTWIGI